MTIFALFSSRKRSKNQIILEYIIHFCHIKQIVQDKPGIDQTAGNHHFLLVVCSRTSSRSHSCTQAAGCHVVSPNPPNQDCSSSTAAWTTGTHFLHHQFPAFTGPTDSIVCLWTNTDCLYLEQRRIL